MAGNGGMGLSRIKAAVWLPTYVTAIMWIFEIAYILLFSFLRKTWISSAPCIIVLLLLQILAFAMTQLTEPGSPPRAWANDVERGAVKAIRHAATGLALPPRARYVRQCGAVVLHLDHYCWFLQRAIGHRNRKFFVLFTGYSLVLSCSALALVLSDRMPIYWRAGIIDCAAGPMPGIMASPFAYDHENTCAHPDGRSVYSDIIQHHQLNYLFAHAEVELGAAYLHAMPWLIPPTALAIAFLAYLGPTSAQLAVRGRVWIDPHDSRYDMGLVANTRQVFGDQPLLWLLPLPGTSATGDGVCFPMNEVNDDTHGTESERAALGRLIASQDGDADEMLAHEAKQD